MKLDIVNSENKKVSEFEIADSFVDVEMKEDLIHDMLLAYLNNQHIDSAKTKTRAEVRGGGKKPWKQKGTGQARHGSIRSPLWKGGGVVFGPQPVKPRFKTNKNSKKEAFHIVVAQKLKDNDVIAIDKIEAKDAKTKSVVTFMKNMKLDGVKTLMLLDKADSSFIRASKNVANLQTVLASNANLYDFLLNAKVVATQKAMEDLIRRAE